MATTMFGDAAKEPQKPTTTMFGDSSLIGGDPATQEIANRLGRG